MPDDVASAPTPSLRSIGLADIQKQFATLQVAERFFDSIVLFALFDLGVFAALAEGPGTASQLAQRLGCSEETLVAILDAAVALKILGVRQGHYEAGEALLDCLGRPGSPAYIGEWIAFLHALAAPLLQLGAGARDERPPGALFEDMGGDSLPARRMTRAMDAYARTRGVELADRMDFSGTRTLLDLGCGPGTYSLAIVERFPEVRATLLDLEQRIAEARELVADRGMRDRVEFVAGDAFAYRPRHGFDVVLVSNTLHMLGPDLSRRLLVSVFSMVNPGGRLLVQAQYLNDDRRSPRWPTLLNLIQRVGTQYGRNHSLGETIAWLSEAGFRDIEHVPLSAWNVNSVLVGRRPHDPGEPASP
ncbi:MAG: methyltransferase [Thermoanaerobaculia bacterium]